jgi:hypothetical protein
MRKIVRTIVVVCASLLAITVAAPGASAATWSSSDKWGTWSNGGYTIRNDVWGGGAGSQSIWANSYSNWGVWANHPNTGGVKAYPHAGKYIGRSISQLGNLNSNFNVSVPNAGAYTTAYDIWAQNNAYEIMLWMNRVGPVGAIGSFQTSVTVGGHSWDVYKGSNGSNQVFSFLRKGNTNAGNVNIKQVMDWLRNRGWMGDAQVGEVQFGYEITSSAGGMNFTTNSYNVSG